MLATYQWGCAGKSRGLLAATIEWIELVSGNPITAHKECILRGKQRIIKLHHRMKLICARRGDIDAPHPLRNRARKYSPWKSTNGARFRKNATIPQDSECRSVCRC